MIPYPVILFLDFDGVLHSIGGVSTRQRMQKLPLLEALLREPGMASVGIVVSSTWRMVHSAAQLRSLFAPDMRERMAGCTPQLQSHGTRYPRSEEIAAWLAAHPAVRSWVALDDQRGAFAPELYSHLVITDGQAALTPRDIDRLRMALEDALAKAAPA